MRVSRLPKQIVPCAAALLLVLGPAACNEPVEDETAILLSITSLSPVDTLVLRIRNYDLQEETLEVPLQGRDLTRETYALRILPSPVLNGRVFLAARGLLGRDPRTAAAAYLVFEKNQTVESAIVLQPDFVDADNDGFRACPAGELCDCDDTDPSASPFRAENCDDGADNNCIGGGSADNCPCSPDEPPIVCTNLARGDRELAGIGACAFGALACVYDPETGDYRRESVCHAGAFQDEIDGNGVDDDCDGTVDEGSGCVSGTTRTCHRGQTGAAAQVLLRGECAKPPPNWPAGAPHHVQSCVDGLWGECKGDRLPQRNDDGIGWAELAASPPPADRPSQCNGLDDDCDGRYDEERVFDPDDDGYTECGSVFDPDPLDREKNTHLTPGLDPLDRDCDNDNAEIHPGAREVCGNAVDEDCRCDHDDPSTSGTDIGGVGCGPTYGYLDCARPGLRAGSPPAGNCKDGPEVYFRGFQATGGGLECFLCNAAFGQACSNATGACTTKREDCSACPVAGAWDPGDIFSPRRPLCRTGVAGTCVNDVAPAWTDIAGSDPFSECGALSCAGYRWGVINGRCFDRAAQTAEKVSCVAGGRCPTAAELCPGETQPAGAPLPQAICKVATSGGCSGTATFVAVNQENDQDLFDECDGGFDCTTSEPANGGGPFYHGLADLTQDAVDNPLCYFRAPVVGSACDGAGACQSRAYLCGLAPRGIEALGKDLRLACTAPTTGTCTGTLAPGYAAIAKHQNPYSDCVGGLTCNGLGACHLSDGTTCSANSACTETCINSTCTVFAGTNGSCDTNDTADCQADHTCVGTTCLLNNDQACAADAQCASGRCDDTCQAKLSTGACNENSDCVSTCVSLFCGPLAGTGGECDTNDTADCQANHTCVGTTCLLNNGRTCTADVQCASGRCDDTCQAKLSTGECDEDSDCTGVCECTAASCPTRYCRNRNCGVCEYDNGSWCPDLNDGIDPHGACSDLLACRTGACATNCEVNDDRACEGVGHCDAVAGGDDVCAWDHGNDGPCEAGGDCVSGNCSSNKCVGS